MITVNYDCDAYTINDHATVYIRTEWDSNQHATVMRSVTFCVFDPTFGKRIVIDARTSDHNQFSSLEKHFPRKSRIGVRVSLQFIFPIELPPRSPWKLRCYRESPRVVYELDGITDNDQAKLTTVPIGCF